MAARPSPPPTTTWIHEYLIEEDEMGDSAAQSRLMDYLSAVLRWLYRADGWFVARNLTCYHPAIANSQQMISPDIAVFSGIPLTPDEQEALTSWDMRRAGHPCPPVMIEVSSDSTWRTDIRPGPEHKPHIYGTIGVREYVAYDPNRPPVWRRQSGRLLGWRYDEHGQPVALVPDARGWLWSAELQSWLVPDGALLHLYDAQGHPRLTEAGAKEAALQEAETALQGAQSQAQTDRRARHDAEAARQDAQAQVETERRARQEAETARQEAEAQAETERRARQEAEAARHQLSERLASLQKILKAHNIDPDHP